MAERTDGSTADGTTIGVEAASDDVAAIRADIRQTRERMSHTVEDIGERLNPDRLKAQLKHNIHDATIGKAEHMARVAVDRVDETRHNIMDNIRDNPIPAAMVGVGLGWLWLNGRRNRHEYDFRYDRGYDRGRGRYSAGYSGYGGYESLGYDTRGYADYDRGEYGQDGRLSRAAERVSDFSEDAMERGQDAAHRAQDRVTGLAHDAKDTVSEFAHDARDTVSDVADRAQDALGHTAQRARNAARGLARETRYGAHRVEDRLEEALRESPLAVGAAAVAIGLAVGLTAPSTRRESELMGPARDEVVNRARHAAEDAVDKVQEVAERVVDSTEESVREATRETGMM